jgi:hypothetical protein
MVVDSCINRDTRRAVALDYFDRIGVDPATSVEVVVGTHWHDDHIGGLDQLVDRCPAGRFYCSAAVTADEIFVMAETAELLGTLSTSGVSTIRHIRRSLAERGQTMERCLESRMLWTAGSTVVWSLAPSSEDTNRALEELPRALAAVSEGRKAPRVTNHASVALWVDFGDVSAILGGDVEAPDSDARGWRAILRLAREGRPARVLDATMLKVPHHGSDDAHCPEFYESLTRGTWTGVVTPFRAGRRHRPSPEDRARLASLGHPIYLTSDAEPGRVRHDRVVDRTLRDGGIVIQSLDPPHGEVRLTRPRAADFWPAEFTPPAVRLAAGA